MSGPYYDPKTGTYSIDEPKSPDISAQLEAARREGVVEGENEFARWIDRKGAIILDSGEDEKAEHALQRYRMGRGW